MVWGDLQKVIIWHKKSELPSGLADTHAPQARLTPKNITEWT
jgi:hypothetical protein